VRSPALPYAGVWALPFEQVVVSAVVPREEVMAVAGKERVVLLAQVSAAAIVVPNGATAEGDNDTAAAQVVPVRAKEVVPSRAVSRCRGGSETRIASSASGSSVVVLLEEDVPVEQTAPWRRGSSASGEHQRLWLRPSWRLLEWCRG
jgi:hypothetical protein